LPVKVGRSGNAPPRAGLSVAEQALRAFLRANRPATRRAA